jgi:hypothetical protein
VTETAETFVGSPVEPQLVEFTNRINLFSKKNIHVAKTKESLFYFYNHVKKKIAKFLQCAVMSSSPTSSTGF